MARRIVEGDTTQCLQVPTVYGNAGRSDTGPIRRITGYGNAFFELPGPLGEMDDQLRVFTRRDGNGLTV
jgi:hypothetical protein